MTLFLYEVPNKFIADLIDVLFLSEFIFHDEFASCLHTHCTDLLTSRTLLYRKKDGYHVSCNTNGGLIGSSYPLELPEKLEVHNMIMVFNSQLRSFNNCLLTQCCGLEINLAYLDVPEFPS